MHVLKIADLWVKLMTEGLGYQRFGAQGGDWGASVTNYLGFAYPQQLLGIHTTSITRPTPYLGAGSPPLTAAEQELLAQREAWLQAEGGYSHIQGTKPQTLSYGLNDSPVGLAGWIVEKYRTWSDCHGEVESRFTKDELLTTITIYWVTQTINSSTRLYYETLRHPWNMQQGERITVPTGVAVFPGKLAGHRAHGASAPSISNAGQRWRVAGISRRWRSRNCWRKILGPSSAPCATETGLVGFRKEKLSVFRFKVVPRDGIEPPTRGFSVLCSTD